MNTKDIRALCINGTQVYYDYLDKNDKGLQRIPVRSITNLPRSIIQIKISGHLFDTEAIFFRFKTNNKKLNTSQVQVISYDKNSKTLLLRPEEIYLDWFDDLNTADLEIISDLKFLVERVRVWYEKNGGAILCPNKTSPLKDRVQQIDFFEDMPPSPSQKKAIETIFEAPFSYIWGAPGTGKTQGVLSYALLHYLKNGYKVAILGPTNNAIEQVLRGVISMTDRANIQRDKIIRLGTPSKTFADQYPEVCEARGIVKQLEDLDNQQKIIDQVLLSKSYEKILSVFESESDIFETLQAIKSNLEDLVIKERSLLVKINGNKRKITRRQKQLQKIKIDIRTIDRRSTLLGPKVSRIFANGLPKMKQEKESLQKEYRSIEDEIDDLEADNELLEQDWNTALEKVQKQKEILNKKIGFIKEHLEKNNASSIVEDLLSGRSELVEAALQEIKKAYQSNQVALGALAKAYTTTSIDILQVQKQEILDQITYLNQYSTEERLKNVSIVSATLDGYIGRFMEEKLNVDHIFVDEAGYANMVKVLTIFNHRVPITLLGDHMQLPPVCEISDQTIARDASYHNAFIWSQSAIFSASIFQKERIHLLEDYVKNAPLSLHRMKKADLNHTYRFGANLAAVLNEYVYKNGFQSALEEAKTSVYYIDAPKPSTAKKKRENEAEVLAIQKIVTQLEQDSFVVLTPYRNQLKLLGEQLPALRRKQQIITVHGSQGREWDTVILSLVDTYDKWFTDSKNDLSKGLNLINTAVSRAKKQLIIVGDIRFWKRQEGQLVKGLVDIAQVL